MHLHEAKITVDHLANWGFRFGRLQSRRTGDDAFLYRSQFESFAPRLVNGILAGDRAAASFATLTPLDEVVALSLNLNLSVDPDFVFMTTVGLRNDGREMPASFNFDFLDEVDAIRVLRCVLVSKKQALKPSP